MEENQTTYTLEVKRIVVALDASTDSLAALRSASAIAAALEAELVGLFVEDENLLRYAGLPFAREMQRATGRVRALNLPDIERDLTLQAARARRALREMARQAEADWHFQVVRGVVAQEILKAAGEADLLSLGRTSRPLFPHLHLGSTAREAIGHRSRTVLLAWSGAEAGGPVHVLFDGSPAGERALVAALRIGHIFDRTVTVLLPATGGVEQTPAGLAGQVEGIAKQMADTPEIEVRKLPAGEEQNLAELVNSAGCSLLVLSIDNPLGEDNDLEALFAALTCPVMLVK